jgi:hypothetical protein
VKRLLLLLLVGISFQSFSQNYDTLNVRNQGDASISEYYLNNILAEAGGGCTGFGHPTGSAVMVAVIDSCTWQPWNNENVDHGHWNQYWDFPYPPTYICRNRSENYFIYSLNNPTSFSSLYHWMHDTVPDGNYVLIYSWLTWSWQSNNNQYLDSLISYLGCPSWPPNDSVPFTFFVQKGEPWNIDTLVTGSTPTDLANLIVGVLNDCPVGIDEISGGNYAVMYPTPAHDNFTLNIPGELSIYDITGRLVLKQYALADSRIDCRSFPKGVYLVNLNNRNKIFNQKLVIE